VLAFKPRLAIARIIPMADENQPRPEPMGPITNREFGDLKNEIYQSGVAAAAIGACIASLQLESDPNRLKALIERAIQMQHGFVSRGQAHAATVMRLFARGIAKPEIFSAFDHSEQGTHDVVT
jgi:hypothetical protein